MRRVVATLALVALLAAFSVPAYTHPVGIPILVDLTHGQSPRGLEIMMKVVPEAEWYILVRTQEDADALPPVVKALAHEIIIGDFSKIDLEKYEIEVVIIGQPQALFTPEEIATIATWFTSKPGKVLWLAADSDYPAQGSETAQQAVNLIAEAIGAHLRSDYVSVEDPQSMALKPYRVLGVVTYCEIPELTFGVTKVLFHGPGAVAWVDDAGNWHKLTLKEKPDNVFIVVTTTEGGTIVEHQAEPTGTTGKAYEAGETGVFTLLAIEKISVEKGESILIVSGESPYAGYQGGVTWMYKGYRLSGPQFFRNLILWATGYMGELKEYSKLAGLEEKLTAKVKSELEAKAKELDKKLEAVKSEVDAKMGEATAKVSKLESEIAALRSQLSTAQGVAIVAIILALGAIALSFMKKPAAK